jgi:hypothetical protein
MATAVTEAPGTGRASVRVPLLFPAIDNGPSFNSTVP